MQKFTVLGLRANFPTPSPKILVIREVVSTDINSTSFGRITSAAGSRFTFYARFDF
jgi:hypothetical protein